MSLLKTGLVFSFGIYGRAQHRAHFSHSQKCTLLPVFSGNACTAYFTAEIKRPYLLSFLTQSIVWSFLSLPLPPSARGLNEKKVSGPRVYEQFIQLFAHHKQKRISSDNLFLWNNLNCQFSTDCILQYTMLYKKHSMLQNY